MLHAKNETRKAAVASPRGRAPTEDAGCRMSFIALLPGWGSSRVDAPALVVVYPTMRVAVGPRVASS
jgi:hypothetical protein